MKTHNLIQGSQEWHDYRAKHFNASDCPAMLGISKYKTRGQLLKEMATGFSQEFDAATEARFADGHRFEVLARPIAEQIIGAELYPVTASEGKLSASFDGLTMDETICFEHKTLNKSNGLWGIAEEYRAQMEQQLMISGATKCLFMASKWDENDTLIEERHAYYVSDQEMRDRIVHGWVQFAKDLENYQHVEEKAAPVAEAIMGLPAVSVQATGMVTASNLPEFKKAADTFIANIKTELVTDEDFVNAEANVKFCKTAEDDLEGAKKAMLAQTSSINEVIQTIDFIKGQLASKRLMLDKLVKSEKENRKLAIVSKANTAYAEHVSGLQDEISGVRISLLIKTPDFAGAMKSLKKLSAMQEAVDTVLRDGIYEADQIAKDVRAKLSWMNEYWFNNGGDYKFLFSDLQMLIGMEDMAFMAVIKTRIADHKAAKAAEEEALRIKLQAEATAKAEREAAAKLAEQEARIRAEERAKAEAEQRAADAEVFRAGLEQEEKNRVYRENEEAQEKAELAKAILSTVSESNPKTVAETASVIGLIKKPSRPAHDELIQFVANNFNVSFGTARDWVIETAESLKVPA